VKLDQIYEEWHNTVFNALKEQNDKAFEHLFKKAKKLEKKFHEISCKELK
jgi:hypothetical protein